MWDIVVLCGCQERDRESALKIYLHVPLREMLYIQLSTCVVTLKELYSTQYLSPSLRLSRFGASPRPRPAPEPAGPPPRPRGAPRSRRTPSTLFSSATNQWGFYFYTIANGKPNDLLGFGWEKGWLIRTIPLPEPLSSAELEELERHAHEHVRHSCPSEIEASQS